MSTISQEAISIDQLIQIDSLLKKMLENNNRLLQKVNSKNDTHVTAFEASEYLNVGYQYFMQIFRKKHNLTEIRSGRRVYFLMSEIVAAKTGKNQQQ